jgi:acyl-CoA synthetase (AMP-forming)/AMP-acid ligase II
LQQQGAAGERVLVLCPPGLDFIAGLFGCLYAGAIAVPVHPPVRDHLVPRVEAIIADVQPTFALSNTEMQARIKTTVDGLVNGPPLRWSVTDEAGDNREWVSPDIDAGTVAMVQYTSGSTSKPKGVVLTHGNLVHNLETIRQTWKSEFDTKANSVFWLPPYHDMGLIGGIFETIYIGGTTVLMPPSAFIKRPMRWLEAMSRHRGVITAAPNFAYDLCVELSTPEQRAALDLSNWSTAMCGAEPVSSATLQGFTDAFAPSGFRPEAWYPVYGMAEATLLISAGSSRWHRNIRAPQRWSVAVGRKVVSRSSLSIRRPDGRAGLTRSARSGSPDRALPRVTGEGPSRPKRHSPGILRIPGAAPSSVPGTWGSLARATCSSRDAARTSSSSAAAITTPRTLS